METLPLPVLVSCALGLLVIALSAYIAATLYRRQQGILASVWTTADRRIMWVATLIGSVLTLAVVVLVLDITARQGLTLAGIMLIGAWFVLEGIWLVRSYRRPGSVLYSPIIIKYWPSWIRVERKLTVGMSTTIYFKLTESVFDIKSLSLPKRFGNDGFEVSDSARLAFVHENTILLPLPKHEERALTDTGKVHQDSLKRVQVRCVGDAFAPECIQRDTTIDALLAEGEKFSVIPKTPGRHIIRISLIAPGMKVAAGVAISALIVGS